MLRFLRCFTLFLRLADLLRHLPNVRREQRISFGQRLQVMAGGGDGAQSTNKLYSHTLLYFLGVTQQNGSDLSRAADMRATTGVQVEVANIDQPQFLALGWR